MLAHLKLFRDPVPRGLLGIAKFEGLPSSIGKSLQALAEMIDEFITIAVVEVLGPELVDTVDPARIDDSRLPAAKTDKARIGRLAKVSGGCSRADLFERALQQAEESLLRQVIGLSGSTSERSQIAPDLMLMGPDKSRPFPFDRGAQLRGAIHPESTATRSWLAWIKRTSL